MLSLFHYCSAVGKAYFWAGLLQYLTICMRVRGEKEKKKEIQKQVLTSNQICCIDFATLALEQIRETATLSLRIRSSLERAGSKGAHPDTQRGTSACTHTRARAGARGSVDTYHLTGPSGGKHSSRRLQKPHDPHFRHDENSRASGQTNELLTLQSNVPINHCGPATAPTSFQLLKQG